MTQVFLMQGLPGSGKSTWVNNQLPGAMTDNPPKIKVFSTDYYWIQPNDKYIYDHKKLCHAHLWCFGEYDRTLQDWMTNKIKVDQIYVDNTNISAWELAPYVQLGLLRGCEVTIVRIECDPYLAARRNTHQVPVERVLRMWRQLNREELPAHWKVKVVLPGEL